MKERLVIAAVLIATVFVGLFSVTTAFGDLVNDAQSDTPDISNSDGNTFFNTPSNTPDASNSKTEIDNHQSNFQKGDVNKDAQNCAEINVNSENSAGDEGLDCHNSMDQRQEDPSTADLN
jgi:hypothetical protein